MERYHLSVRSPTQRAQENAIKDNNKTEMITNYLYELNKISRQYPPH